jgi:hypothetical protein
VPFGGALSAGIGAGTSLLGGIFGSKAAKNAAKAQQQNAQQVVNLTSKAVSNAQTGVTDAASTAAGDVNNATGAGLQSLATGTAGANDILSNQSTNLQNLYNPFIKAGTDSLTSLQSLAGPGGPLSQQFQFDPNDVSKNPGYQFTLKQGQDAIQRAAAAQGNLFSTGTLKSLAGYTAGTANQYENQFYNQALNTFNTNRQGVLSQIGTLQGLAGLGAGATSGAASGTSALAGQQANNLFGGGEFGANLGLQGAATAGGFGLQGATTAGGYGLQGAQIEGNALTAGANAKAAGTVGSTNSWLNALNGGTNNILQYLATPGGFGGQTGNGSGSYQGYNPTPYSTTTAW